MKKEERAELIGRLIDVVEDWLTDKTGDEDTVFIQGADHDILAEKFAVALGLDEDDGKAQEPLTADTPLGQLIAYPSNNSENPGIYIDLHRDTFDCDAPLALIEYTSTEADVEGGTLITRVWSDVSQEDYSDRHIHTGVEEFFDAPVNRYFYTFGSDPGFPFNGGYVEVHAATLQKAHEKFRKKYPDRHKKCINCAFFYTEEQWEKTEMSKMEGYKRHEVIE